MRELKPGLKGQKEMTVGRRDLASHTGNMGANVLSTHRVVLLAEQAARDAIEGCLSEGKITVGTMIKLRHFAATPPGGRVRAEAFLREVAGRRLLFDVVVFDEFEKISEGQNERFIISEKKFMERVNKKTTNP